MKRKFNIVLHIGTEKTGTTTIQKALHQNKHYLLENGFAYAHGKKLTNSRDLSAACLPDNVQDDYLIQCRINSPLERNNFRETVHKRLSDYILHLPETTSTLLISSEHFHSRLRDENAIDTLKCMLEPHAHSFKIIVYLRRQVDMATSLYSTSLKGGATHTFNAFINRTLVPSNPYFNYDILTSRWGRVFGRENLTVRLYSDACASKGGLLFDFLGQFDARFLKLDVPHMQHNESINHIGQIILRELNKLSDDIPVPDKKAINKLRRKISETYAGKGPQLEPCDARALQNRFDPSNEIVKSNWFPDKPYLFNSNFSEETHRLLNDLQEESLSEAIAFNLSKRSG